MELAFCKMLMWLNVRKCGQRGGARSRTDGFRPGPALAGCSGPPLPSVESALPRLLEAGWAGPGGAGRSVGGGGGISYGPDLCAAPRGERAPALPVEAYCCPVSRRINGLRGGDPSAGAERAGSEPCPAVDAPGTCTPAGGRVRRRRGCGPGARLLSRSAAPAGTSGWCPAAVRTPGGVLSQQPEASPGGPELS